MSARALLLAALLAPAVAAPAAPTYQPIAAAEFESVLPATPGNNRVKLASYRLARTPVTNADYLAFVTAHPEWRRDQVAALFADGNYLRHWGGPLSLGQAGGAQPVTNVSWFAAAAYCEAQQARLPTWYEWERAAAADAERLDARGDEAWRQRILNWYSKPNAALQAVGQDPANVHGLHDLHGLVWEWVEDFGAMMVSGDNREQGDPDLMKFCGSGALSLEQKEHYAILMRIAMLSSLRASYTGEALGFRCARDGP